MGRPLESGGERKVYLAARIPRDLSEWVEENSGRGKRFKDKTHVVEYALERLRHELEE